MTATLHLSELSLAELLQEPMVRQLMWRDHVSFDQMQETLRRAGFGPEALDGFLEKDLARVG